MQRPGRITGIVTIVAALSPIFASAQTRLNFVSCPIVRDTSSVPCWLTEYAGELYYMGIQTDVSAEFHPPYLGHKVLVEAVVAGDRPRICGGIVLDPIKISVMPELDGTCNTILPAEDQYTIDFNPRPPGPSGGRLAFEPPPGASPAQPKEPARGPKTFRLYFDIDRDIAFRHPAELVAIRDYAREIGARHISVHATRGATLLTDGGLVTESEHVARRRSEKVAELLRGLGTGAEVVSEYTSKPEPADGIDDWMSRRVEVHVAP
jgi:hypothetical protein